MNLTVLIPATDAEWAIDAAAKGRTVDVLLDGAVVPVVGRVHRVEPDELDASLIRAEMTWTGRR